MHSCAGGGDLADSRDRSPDVLLHHQIPVAAAYGILGAVLALLSITFMIMLATIPPAIR